MLNRLHESRKLFENLICYIWQGRGNNANAYLFPNVLRGDRPHVLIDPGFLINEMGERCFESVTAAMRRDGFEAEDIGLIVNTHTHPDHCQATDSIVEMSMARESKGRVSQAITALSRVEEEYYRTVGERMFGMFGMKAAKLEPFMYLTEGTLNLGTEEKRISLEIFLTPGHSPGSISIYWPDKKVLITGDLIFYGGVGRTDFPGGSITTLKQSIERLSALEVEFLLPGHSTELGSIVEGRDKVERNLSAIRLML